MLFVRQIKTFVIIMCVRLFRMFSKPKIVPVRAPKDRESIVSLISEKLKKIRRAK